MPAERHLHLEPVGGAAGDMFVAAILDAFPELAPPLLEALDGLDLPAGVGCAILAERRGGLRGTRFVVRQSGELPHHAHYGQIREQLAGTGLAGTARERALALLELLADAEAAVHGIAREEVHFHELAGWDTVVDLAAAAWLIERVEPCAWSVGPVPLGRGRVRTAHGLLPVPAPATARLLEGFALFDDGIAGERVTPTGAAILRHLTPGLAAPRRPMLLAATGAGLGSRELEGTPNMLRLLVLETAAAPEARDRVGLVRFEIDDQTGEDLAIGLERVRAHPAVLDVVQWPVVGKRGRLGAAVQTLCRPDAVEEVAALCLCETTTLGVRLADVERRILPREEAELEGVRVKRVRRPDGRATAKAEARDVEAMGDAGERSRARRRVETAALEEDEG